MSLDDLKQLQYHGRVQLRVKNTINKECKTRGADRGQTFWNLGCVKTFDHHPKNSGKLLKSSELHLHRSF